MINGKALGYFNLYNETVTPTKTGKRDLKNHTRYRRTDLRYAQVIKERKEGKLVKVHKQIIFGNMEDISSSDITTSPIERQNLTFRQENERLVRKTIGF